MAMKYLIAILMALSCVMAVPLAVIDSKYVQYDQDTLAPSWQIHLRGDNNAEYIKFVNSEEITGTVDGQQARAEESFTLTSSIISESCVYNLLDSSQRIDIYQYELRKVATDVSADNVQNAYTACERDSSCLYSLYDQKLIPWRFDVYNIYKNKIAVAGEVSGGKMNFESKFTISKESGAPVSTVINTQLASKSGVPGVVLLKSGEQTVGSVRWVGGATYGEFCPAQSDVISLQKNNVWYTGNKDRYGEYLTLYGDLIAYFDTVLEDQYLLANKEVPESVRNTIQTKINAVNGKSGEAMNPYTIRLGNNIANSQGATSVLALPRDHLIYLPDFVVNVRADYLKIVYLIGKPKILKAEFTKCDESAINNEIKVSMQNVGASEGKFNVGVTCVPNINAQIPLSSLTLKPQETGTFTIPFGLSLQEDANVKCTTTVADVNNPENKVSTQFTQECLSSKICAPEGKVDCQGTVQYKCVQGNWIPQPDSVACKQGGCNDNGKCEPALNETFELCGGKIAAKNDCATCNADKICDATETVISCPSDCAAKKDGTIWIIGGAAAAGAAFFAYTKLTKKRKRR